MRSKKRSGGNKIPKSNQNKNRLTQMPCKGRVNKYRCFIKF